MPVLIQCGFEKQTVQYMEPRNTPEINENQIYSDQITFSFVTVSLDHPVLMDVAPWCYKWVDGMGMDLRVG